MLKRLIYNTYYFLKKCDGKHNVSGYLKFMNAVM
jgi:hypothetical protein